MGNLFAGAIVTPEERFDVLVSTPEVLVERIVSSGQATPPGEWLQGERDEWVALLEGEAELSFDDGSQVRLGAGDHVFVPAGRRHRVEWTRARPPCVWLAVHASGLEPGRT